MKPMLKINTTISLKRNEDKPKKSFIVTRNGSNIYEYERTNETSQLISIVELTFLIFIFSIYYSFKQNFF